MPELEELVIRAQQGEKNAFGEIYKIYLPKIYRFIYFSIRNKEIAEDLAQSTFLRAWKKLASFSQTKGSFQGYLFTIARNLIIDWQRRKKEISIEFVDIPQDSKSPEEEIQQDEIKKAVWNAIFTLDDIERLLILMRYFEELSYKDIARIVGANEGAIRVRVHRILIVLKKAIKNVP